jgi:hypothetical protein
MRKSLNSWILRIGAAAVFPLLVSAAWLSYVPPLWLYMDSTTILVFTNQLVPHYPPLYPLVVTFFKWWFGTTGTMLHKLFLFQHLVLICAVTYLALAFHRLPHVLTLSVAATAGVWGGSFAHMVASQAIDLPVMVLFCGVLFRYYNVAWKLRLFPIFVLSSLGLALTRHASVVFAVALPIYFTLLAAVGSIWRYFSIRCGWSHLRHAAASCVAIGLVVITATFITRGTCWAWGYDCAYSLIGRAGCYRIAETFKIVPSEQRETWLSTKGAGFPAGEAFAFRAMATIANCWLGPRTEISAAYPTDDPDRLMSSAYLWFLASPDEFSLRQMLSQLRSALYVDFDSSPWVGASLGYSISVSALTLPGAHDEMRLQLDVNTRVDSPQLIALSSHPMVLLYDWYTRHCLTLVALVCIIIAVAQRNARVLALELSLASTGFVYLICVTIVTLMASYYIAPFTLMMYLLTGISFCTLLDRLTTTFFHRGPIACRSPVSEDPSPH